MKKTVLIFTMALLIGTLSTTAMAFQGKGGLENSGKGSMQVPIHRWWKFPKAAEKLNITPEETEKLDALYQKSKEQLIDSEALLKKNMLKLEMQFDSDPFDSAKCLKNFNDAQTARTKLAMEKFKFALQSREILGKERFEQLKNTFRQFRQQHSKKAIQNHKGKMSKPKNNKEDRNNN